MTSNQDILAFLKSEKEAREKEKLQEAEIRAKEREQDMAKIAKMISLGVRDEVKAAVEPVKERLDDQEKTCQGLGTQIQNLMTELAGLKGEVQTIKDFPNLSVAGASVTRSCSMTTGGDRICDKKVIEVDIDTTESEGNDNDDRRKVLEICSRARRIIGFQPIEPRMIELQKVAYGAKDTEEAMIMEIKSYLKCEMKVRPHDIEKLEIVRIFPPSQR